MPSRTKIVDPDELDAIDDIVGAAMTPPRLSGRQPSGSSARGTSARTSNSASSDTGPLSADSPGTGSVRRRLIKVDLDDAQSGNGLAASAMSSSRDLPSRDTPSRKGTNRSSQTNGHKAANGPSGSSHSSMLPQATKHPPRALAYEIVGILLIAIGGCLLYNASRFQAEGLLTEVVVGALRWSVGIGAIVMPALLCWLGLLLIVRRHQTNLRAFTRGTVIGCFVLFTAVHLTVPQGYEFLSPEVLFSHGGYVGASITWALRRSIGEVGAIIALVAFSIVALLFFTEVSLSQLASGLGRLIRGGARKVVRGVETHNALQLADQDFVADEPEYFVEATHRNNNRRKLRALPEEIIRDSQAQGAANFESKGFGHDEFGALDGESHEHGQMGKRPQRSPFIALDEVLKHEVENIQPGPVTFKGKSDSKSDSKSPNKPNPQSAIENPQSDGPRIEIVDTPPPPSVVEPASDTTGESALESQQNSEPPVVLQTPIPSRPLDEMTPIEALEAQALATAGTGTPVKKQRPQQLRRRFGEGPLMPEYFDNGVRALDPPITPDVQGVEDDIQRGVQSVQETLASFKIDARVTDVKRGPVITRYEVQPAPGVRVAAIANLDRDLARALSAIAVRIEAPVPGKNVVGIEVPNKRVHLVRVRDVLELPEFLSAPSKLAFVLGKDIAGQAKWADLTKMPHLLIAGSTNSGKSVCLNSIITSILVRATPDEVKFSLIDPKRVELTLYKDIKHLYHPVVVEPKDAVKALRGAIAEMDRRYKRFAERGVRNIASYNSKLEEGEAPLPYIVIVIDELADLMLTAAAEFEKLFCSLAQLARATGIHLIVATQRPSVNVITGVIKANIPARIAFAVASQVDSRTILDTVGAERLIGSGDMLFDNNTGGKPTRIQGAYLSEEEVNRIVDVVKSHYADDDEPLEYGLDLSAIEEPLGSDDDDDSVFEEKRDDLYDVIKEFVLRNTEMSASMIQRKFEIGYPRAGRIVDQLEREGILSPADGSKARKVIGTGR